MAGAPPASCYISHVPSARCAPGEIDRDEERFQRSGSLPVPIPMGDLGNILPHSLVWSWPSPPVPEPKPGWEAVTGLTFRTLVTLRTKAPRVSLELWELLCTGLVLPAL